MTMAAGITENRSILQKADLALSDLVGTGGLLQPAQAAKFMRIMIKASRVLGMATVVPMRSPKQWIEKIAFGSRILRPGVEAQALAAGDRAKPDTSRVEMSAELFKAEVRLDNEVLEDNIERAELRQTIMQMMSERIALDVEELVVNGDTASSDPLLAKMDGLLKQSVSHIYDAAGATISKATLRNMLRTMPSQYLRDKRTLRYLTSVNAEITYRDSLADRQTVGGDRYLEQDVPTMYNGVPVVDVPLFPETLGAGSNQTNIVLVDPKNINVGVWRNIRIETDKLVSEGVLIIVATMRLAVKYAHEDAVVKAINVAAS